MENVWELNEMIIPSLPLKWWEFVVVRVILPGYPTPQVIKSFHFFFLTADYEYLSPIN